MTNSTIKAALWSMLALAGFALAACGGSEPESLQFSLAIEERQLEVAEGELIVKQDDSVSFVVETDEDGAFHLHGYDLERELAAGETATLSFDAYATGRFTITFHPGGASHSHATEHGVMFESDTLRQGDSYSYLVGGGMSGKTIPYHNHMNHEMTAHIMVSADAEESRLAEVAILEDGSFSPAMLSVQPGAMVVWTNTAAERQRVASGDPPAMPAMGDGEAAEVSLGVLEVRPR